MSRPQKCQHLKSDGSRCGSPALRDKRPCYFHHASRVLHPNRIGRPAILPELPVLEDASIASLLQLASANLENMER